MTCDPPPGSFTLHAMDLNEQVTRELNLIPRGDFHQNELRMLYQMMRSRALGAKSEELLTPQQILERATAMIRRESPAFEPHYDPELLSI